MTDELGSVSRETEHPSRVSRETWLATSAAAREPDSHVSRETSGAWQFARELTNAPLATEAAQAVSMHARVMRWPRPAVGCRVLAVANQKGGVGKTTSTVNLAAALALHGLKVLVVDLDPQGNATTALGVAHPAGTPSVYDALLGESPLSAVTVAVDAVDGLFCAPSTIDLAGAEVELANMVDREYRLRRALEPSRDGEAGFDYIFVDCPPSLGQLTLNGLVAARELLLPIQCEFYALEGLAQLLSTVELVKSHLNPPLEVSTVLLTMYDARTRLADQVAAEVRRHFGDLVVPGAIPRAIRVSEAPGFAQTVMTYDPGSRGALAYLNAAEHLARSGAEVATHGSAATTSPRSTPTAETTPDREQP